MSSCGEVIGRGGRGTFFERDSCGNYGTFFENCKISTRKTKFWILQSIGKDKTV